MTEIKNLIKILFLFILGYGIFLTNCGSQKPVISGNSNFLWQMYGKNAGHNNYSNVELGLPLEKAWETKTDAGIGKSLAVKGDLLFASAMNGKFYIFDIKTGKRIDKLKIRDAILAGPVVKDNYVFIAKQKGRETLLCYNFAEGSYKWKIKAGNIENTPALFGEKLYVTNYEGYILCVDVSNGIIDWKVKYGSPLLCSPAVSEKYVIAGDSKGVFLCINRKDGKKAWDFKSGGNFWGSPVIFEDNVFICDRAGNIYNLDLSNGSAKWQKTVDGAFYNSPGVNKNLAVFGCNNGRLYAYDTVSGGLIWEYDASSPVTIPPLLTKDYVVSGTLAYKLIINDIKTGKKVWEYLAEGRLRTAPVVFKDFLIFASENKNLYALKTQ